MEQTFTATQLWSAVLAMCGAIVSISAAATVIAKAVNRAKEPNKKQDERLAALEARVAKHDELFAKDKRRIDAIEEGNRITQRAILSLLEHGISGDALDDMRAAKDELQKFLINR